MVAGAAERRKRDSDVAVTQAWLTAVWQRAKRIPRLESLIGSKRKVTREEIEEIEANWDEVVEQFEASPKRPPRMSDA